MRGHVHNGRVDWVDYAKGFCIVMVVTMHSTLGVEAAGDYDGWMHPLVEFARPFRMPDFFLISGLFLALVIDRPWRDYLDKKVVHFAYFYVMWMAIQVAFKSPVIAADQGVAGVFKLFFLSLIEPFGTLWFIYLLPVFFVVTKLTLRVPIVAVWLIAAALEISHIHTGWTLIDEFASRYIYFYTGYVLAPHIFRVAKGVQQKPWKGFLLLALWAPGNYVMVRLGWSQAPFVSLALGLVGAAAVVRLSALLSLSRVFTPLRYCGEHSIVIYLAFFLPMAITRTVLLKTGIITDIGTISALVTMAGVTGPLCLYWLVRNTGWRFLFERPAAFKLSAKRRGGSLVAAE